MGSGDYGGGKAEDGERFERALLEAARAGDEARLARAIEGGADPDAKLCGEPALALALSSGSVPCVNMLLRAGADADSETAQGEPVLIKALRLGHGEMAKAMLGAGADPDAESPVGVRAVHLAARSGIPGLVELLLERGADAGSEDAAGESLLILAARAGDESLARRLLAAGADPDAEDSFGAPALALAISSGVADLVCALTRAGASADAEDERGEPMLARAIRRADAAGLSMLRELLRAGADAGATDARGGGMAACAYEEGGAQGAAMLAALAQAAGGSLDWEDERGEPLLARAIEERRFDWVEELAAAGADVYGERAGGESCVHLAMRDRRSMGALQKGIERGQKIDSSKAGEELDDFTENEEEEPCGDEPRELPEPGMAAIFAMARDARSALGNGAEGAGSELAGAARAEPGRPTGFESMVEERELASQAKIEEADPRTEASGGRAPVRRGGSWTGR